ncbi:methionyl-tRNA formyltransferase [Algoriphagus sediminis]|uniref:Methionyl-tRNA formyltransferase n=1 Tax=Algoriphagus sediminis TaxID=3057113 RepID=A0ABT7YAJ5_9BACT|nr:methionyl-tRNA formyltransferase [Algoriphagus sediminis]MDN3203528.1 methionyl-tRNA formyltransferase [Algoriphagus sediminis]
MSKDLRIIYMGTPEFAVPSLEKLVDAGWNVVAVITAPDKPKGRGQKLIPSPVKVTAEKLNIPVLQPKNLKSEGFLEELRSYHADLQIVVAFRMLPVVVWDMPRLGTFNLHASLLPDYRGAAPINWAIINGEKETGVTTFFLKHEIDTGSLLLQEKTPIGSDENLGDLYERLMEMGSDLVLKTVENIATGKANPIPQDESKAKNHAPKIFKETCEINWSKNAKDIHNLVRGLSPFPSAFTKINGKNCKIFRTALESGSLANSNPGEWETDQKSFLKFQTGDGVISVEELQLEGKKRMKIQDFLRGNSL